MRQSKYRPEIHNYDSRIPHPHILSKAMTFTRVKHKSECLEPAFCKQEFILFSVLFKINLTFSAL